jgi:hypothetical protein
MLRKLFVLISLLLIFLSTACAGTPSETPDTTQQSKETSVAATQCESEARATAEKATEQAEFKAATDQVATDQAIADQTATQEYLEAKAEARAATHTAVAAEALVEATAQAKPMADLIQELYEEGYLSSNEGTYYALPDFDESWAQLNWYMWWITDYSPSNFVIRADASWDSASTTADWWNSGCGFVFREAGTPNHYLAYLGLNGRVYLSRNIRDNYANLGNSYYGKLDTPSGEAQIMLLVDGSTIIFFVNGTKVIQRDDQNLYSGNLALTLLSGTNKDYGIRCQMTNIELWELK